MKKIWVGLAISMVACGSMQYAMEVEVSKSEIVPWHGSSLAQAINRHDIEAVKRSLSNGVDANIQRPEIKITFLLQATNKLRGAASFYENTEVRGWADKYKQAAQEYRSVDCGFLKEAVRKDNLRFNEELSIVELIIPHCSPETINYQDEWGDAALHHLCEVPMAFDIISMILKHGADAALKNNSGRTPGEVAGLYKNKKAEELFGVGT